MTRYIHFLFLDFATVGEQFWSDTRIGGYPAKLPLSCRSRKRVRQIGLPVQSARTVADVSRPRNIEQA